MENPIHEISNNPTLYEVDLISGPESFLPLSLSISVPSDSIAGSYSSRLIFLGVLDE